MQRKLYKTIGNFNVAPLVAPKCKTSIDKIQITVDGFFHDNQLKHLTNTKFASKI